MPLSTLTDEQVVELLAVQPMLLRIPGVVLVWADFIDPERTEVGVVATVYAGEGHRIARLPVTVAGLPVIVKVEDPYTMRVIEVIDPRKNGGTWPSTNHHDRSGI